MFQCSCAGRAELDEQLTGFSGTNDGTGVGAEELGGAVRLCLGFLFESDARRNDLGSAGRNPQMLLNIGDAGDEFLPQLRSYFLERLGRLSAARLFLFPSLVFENDLNVETFSGHYLFALPPVLL